MQSLLQIIVVGPVEDKTYEGRSYKSQSCECIILNDDGSPVEVGVLSVPDALREVVAVGYFAGSFAIRANKRRDGGRRIEAVLVGLRPLKRSGNGFVGADPASVSPPLPSKAS